MDVFHPEAGLEPFRHRVAQQALGFLADEGELERIGVRLPDDAVGSVNQVAKAKFRVLQRLLGLLAFGDVARNAVGAYHIAFAVVQRPTRCLEDANTIDRGERLFAGSWTVRVDDFVIGQGQPCRFGGRINGTAVASQNFLSCLAYPPAGGSVIKEVTALVVLDEDGVVRAFHQGVEQFEGMQFLVLGLAVQHRRQQAFALTDYDDADRGHE